MKVWKGLCTSASRKRRGNQPLVGRFLRSSGHKQYRSTLLQYLPFRYVECHANTMPAPPNYIPRSVTSEAPVSQAVTLYQPPLCLSVHRERSHQYRGQLISESVTARLLRIFGLCVCVTANRKEKHTVSASLT